MRELLEQLRSTLELQSLAENRQWRVVRRRIREDFRAYRQKRFRLAELAGNGCPKGAHFNVKSKKCTGIEPGHELNNLVDKAHESSRAAHYSDGKPRERVLPHAVARSHHARAAVAAYHHGFLDLANDHAKMATHHEKIAAKIKNPPIVGPKKG